MGWNDAYWKGKENRKQQAVKHHEDTLKVYGAEISKSVQNTKIYSQKVDGLIRSKNTPESIVVNLDTVSAVFEYGIGDDRTAVLNFASYKNPGGGFLAGSSAQEESLCMESDLFEVISNKRFDDFYTWNNAHKNKALYTNRGLFSPGIIFEKNGKTTTASVITVAAPNRKAYMDYIPGANEEENFNTLRSRIQFVADIISDNNIDTTILGAFGCGVFAQDPKIVASLFKEVMSSSTVNKVIYAVIDKGGHSKEGAYNIFKNIF